MLKPTRKLSKTVEEYLNEGGWSSSQFFEHAKLLFFDYDLNRIGEFEFGRTVVYYTTGRHLFKFYVHYKGKSKDYLSIVDGDTGEELEIFHYTATAEQIKAKLFMLFKREPRPLPVLLRRYIS